MPLTITRPVSAGNVIAAIALLLSLITAIPSATAEEKPLSGDDIRVWLTDHTAIGLGSDWKQYFSKDGATPYWAPGGAKSLGYWSVRGDEYCSRWPPNTDWTCYKMSGEEKDGTRRVSWIAPSGIDGRATLLPGNQAE